MIADGGLIIDNRPSTIDNYRSHEADYRRRQAVLGRESA